MALVLKNIQSVLRLVHPAAAHDVLGAPFFAYIMPLISNELSSKIQGDGWLKKPYRGRVLKGSPVSDRLCLSHVIQHSWYAPILSVKKCQPIDLNLVSFLL